MPQDSYDVSSRDPLVGDQVFIHDEAYRVAERCPCGPDSMHIRWFLETDATSDLLHLPQEGVLAKEWDESGEEAWWFGQRIGASDLKMGQQRLTERLRKNRKTAPKRLTYEGRSYQLAGVTKPPKKSKDEGLPMTVWEYVDKDEQESLLVETSTDGDLVAYHGWYSNPQDIRLS